MKKNIDNKSNLRAINKIVLILLIFYFLLNKNKYIKVCLCTLGKKENRYVREFVGHYKKYGVDKIIIYDNNDLNSEKFETVLSDYIKDDYVEIQNYRGKDTIQINTLKDCYKNNYKKYDWFIMVDMDEYIFLKNFKNNVKSFLNDKRFVKCNLIYLNRVFHTDNNQIYYKNRSLFERFPNYKTNVTSIKSIVRGHISNLNINSIHGVNYKYKACNGFGHLFNKKKKMTDFKYNYFDHFYFKSTEEFIDKINRGDAFFNINKKIKFRKINSYFALNTITIEKIKLFEQRTGINMDYFKNKISKRSK